MSTTATITPQPLPLVSVVSPRIPALAARLAQLCVAFGIGKMLPASCCDIPQGASLFLDFSGHIGELALTYYAAGWVNSQECPIERDGITWRRECDLMASDAEEQLEALVREVEALCGIEPTSFAMIEDPRSAGAA